MARVLSLLLLAIAGALAWLSLSDRRSPLALDVVEWDSRLGVPLWVALALTGALVLVLSFLGRSSDTGSEATPSPPAGSGPPQAPGPTDRHTAPSAGWREEVVARARALSWEDGVSLALDAGPDLPFELRLRRATPERTRRSLGTLARFLSAIPSPGRVRVVFEGGLDGDHARNKLVEGILRQHFPPGDLRAVGTQDHVDVIFTRPDPRWKADTDGEKAD
jgi:hypothetical protein